MPAKRQSPTPPQPPWQVILKEMRSQNHATIEAVEASRKALEERIDRLDRRTEERITVVETAVRNNSADIRRLQGEAAGG